MSQLVLLTSSFPYGIGEQFLETEILFLSEYFDKVIIVPLQIYGNCRYVPSNVIIDKSYAKQNKKSIKRKIFKLTRVFFSTYFYHEIFENFYKFKRIYNIRLLISELSEAYLLSEYLKKYIKNSNLFYSYWNGVTALSLVLLKKKVKNIKIITRVHKGELYEELYPNNYLPMRKFIYENIDTVYSISQDGIEYIYKNYNINKNKLILSRLGVKKQNFKALMNQDKNIFSIISCSRFVEEKRFDLVIQVINNFAKQSDKNIIWYHIGYGNGFEYYKALAFKNKPDNLTIEFKGLLQNSEVFEFYKSTPIDIFINLSSSEGIPVSIMEAYSCGIPAIATNVGGVSELVNKENGFLLEKNFKVKDAINILNVISNNRKILERKKEKALETWETYFNAENNYRNFFNSIKEYL